MEGKSPKYMRVCTITFLMLNNPQCSNVMTSTVTGAAALTVIYRFFDSNLEFVISRKHGTQKLQNNKLHPNFYICKKQKSYYK